MATLVAIGYPDQATAEQARQTVSELESELIIQADQVASISRDVEGKYHVHTSHGGASAGGGAWWGGFWGFLFGLLFFIPFAGLALGAGTGCAVRPLRQAGDRQGVPGAGARVPEAGHLGAVPGDRAGHAPTRRPRRCRSTAAP